MFFLSSNNNLAHVTFALRRGDCPPVKLCGEVISHKDAYKYLGMALDRWLTWREHILKRKHLYMVTRKMYWILCPKSALNLESTDLEICVRDNLRRFATNYVNRISTHFNPHKRLKIFMQPENITVI